jgi:hypothetical protein
MQQRALMVRGARAHNAHRAQHRLSRFASHAAHAAAAPRSRICCAAHRRAAQRAARGIASSFSNMARRLA